ncbi:MAG: DNA-binding protein [Verrucomicrobiales bacterium]|nr:DNA-binding protein [Verrucomicrobiales bacterium]|tara:strand:+ start:328 stop:603 length:276 start_codon:yes stop_codon:yes gene_type:complete
MFEEEEEEEEEGNGSEYKRRRDEPLYTEKIFSDRKVFFVDLKSNDRGRFLKITEDVRGRRDTIMVPEESLQELIDALQNVSDYLKNEDSED